MEKKLIFLTGDMELDIKDTSCPSNKTSDWKYDILTLPIVDITFTNSQNSPLQNQIFQISHLTH